VGAFLMGLLLAHKRTLKVWNDCLSVSDAGNCMQVGGGLRGNVVAFSKESRLRLFKLLHTLKFKTITFMTLTYPLEFPTEPRIYKAHLKEFRRRFERRYGNISGIWRLEFQKRGAPHYHILYLNCPFIPVLDLCELWADVVHSTSAAHRKIGVDIELVTNGSNSKLVAAYVGKYVAKVDDRNPLDVKEKPGRWWGKWNIEENLPIEVEVQTDQAYKIVEKLVRLGGTKQYEPTEYTKCTILGQSMGEETFKKLVLQIIHNEVQ
jgi:hypothetical protein